MRLPLSIAAAGIFLVITPARTGECSTWNIPRTQMAIRAASLGNFPVAQTADRSAAPPNSATAAPPAHGGTYSISNGELIVAPGLRIPNGNVPWALDTVGGKQVLVPIHHAELSLPANAAAGTIEGVTSRTPLHATTPVFFIHTSDRTENTGDAGRGTPTGWALLPAVVSGTQRTVARVKFSDVSAATVCTAPVVCMVAESLPDGWLRITPRDPLPPGEYVLLPVTRAATSQTGLAYDFSVDEAGPAARDAVAPGQNLDVQETGKKKKR